LYLKQGTPLDYQSQSEFQFVVSVDDVTLGGSPDDARQRTLRLSQTPALTIIMTPASVSESAGSARATIYRTMGTSGPVLVQLSSSDTSAATVPESLEIPATRGSVSFDVAVLDDEVADGDQTVTISVEAEGYRTATGKLSISDDEVGQLVVTIDAESISELGGVAHGSVSRNTQTGGAISVALSSNAPDAVTVEPEILLLEDLQTAAFTITAIDNDVANPDALVTISATAADHVAGAASLRVRNDDEPGYTFETNGPTSEKGDTALLTLSLESQPGTPIDITFQSQDSSECQVWPEQVTLQPGGLPIVSVTATGVDDDVDDGDATCLVRFLMASDDANYDGLEGQLDIVNTDDDTVGIQVSPVTGDTGEDGSEATFTVRLGSEPLSEVSFDVVSGNTREGLVKPERLTFDAGNWNKPVTVTITGQDDAIVDGDVAYAIAFTSVTSGDPLYEGLEPSSVPLLNLDDDVPVLAIDIEHARVGETHGSVSATVHRNAKLDEDLVVVLESEHPAVASVANHVTIPADELTASATIVIHDDILVETNQFVTITATAKDFGSSQTEVEIIDDDGWQNPNDPFDVNNDTQVTPIDVLVIINELNEPEYVEDDGSLPDLHPAEAEDYDVNGDDYCTTLDALLIINKLNSEGEGEAGVYDAEHVMAAFLARSPALPWTAENGSDDDNHTSTGQSSARTVLPAESPAASSFDSPLAASEVWRSQTSSDLDDVLDAIATDVLLARGEGLFRGFPQPF
jgi:hypothetical protein